MNNETLKYISDFLHKEEDDKLKIIIPILKRDFKHKFSNFGNYTLTNIAKETIRCIRDYSGFNESSPISVYGSPNLKVCFQPSFKDKNRFDIIVSYFAHMVTGDVSGGLRAYNPAKAKAMKYIVTILQYPDKIYIQNKDKNSYLFERKIAINSHKDNSHAVLYVEKMSDNLLRVVTVLPHVSIKNTERQKEDMSIEEIDISSFVEIRNSISPSPTGEFGNGGELLSNLDITNIQHNFIECTPEDDIILKLTDNQQDNFLNQNEMSKETIEKIEKLEKSINSAVTPEPIKVAMRKALEVLKSENIEVVEPIDISESPITEEKPAIKYNDIKSCLLDDGDDNDDYIFEGKQIHNIETLPKDTWEITEFYKDGVILKHIPTSVLADHKPNKSVSFSELKTLFSTGKIEVDGIETGNVKVFNLCIKAIEKCISNINETVNKESVISELNLVKNDLEKNIEKANLLETEKADLLNKNSDLEKTSIDKISNLEKESIDKISNLEKESNDKISSLESSINDKTSSFEKAKIISEAETARLKKQLEDLEALNIIRGLIDMLNEDVMRKDLKELRVSDKEPIVEQVLPKQKIKVKSITIHNAEGSGSDYPTLPKTYTNSEYAWLDSNVDLIPIYENAIQHEGESNASRFTVTFEDGETYEGDLLLGKYDNPYSSQNVIGSHIDKFLQRSLSPQSPRSDEDKKEIKEFLDKYDLGLNTEVSEDELNKFIDYVDSFYGKDGIYAEDFKNKGFTKDELTTYVNKYISEINEKINPYFTWGGGDSVDRERVREYLQPMGLKYREGDFVFANMDTRDTSSKTPFVVSHYSNGKYYILGDGSHYVAEDDLSLATEKDFDEYYGESAASFKKFENGGAIDGLSVPYEEFITHTKGNIDLTKSRDDFSKEFAELYAKQNNKRITPKVIGYFRNDSGSYHRVRDVLEDIETNDFNDVVSVFKRLYPSASSDWKDALKTGLLIKAGKTEGNYSGKPFIYNDSLSVRIREAGINNMKPIIEEILSDDKYENGGEIKSLYKIRFDGALGEGLYFVTEANSPKEANDVFYKERSSTDRIKSEPEKTTKSFIGNAKKINDTHWIVYNSNGNGFDDDNIIGEFYYDTRKGKAFRVISIDGTTASGFNRKDGTSDLAIQYYSDDKKPVGEIETVNSNQFNYLVKQGAWNKWKQSYFEKGGAIKGVRENIVLKADEILGVDSSIHFVSDNEFTIEPMSEDKKFDGMALNLFSDGTYEVAEFLAGKDGTDLYIFGNYKSLVPALKSLALGNSSTGRKPIKVEKFENGGGINTESRIDKMVKSWNEQGKAWSHISNDDNDFFERIGVPYDKIGTSSNTGTDLIYYDTDRYDFGGKKKLEKGGDIAVGDIVRFIKKSDKKDVVNAEILDIDESIVGFINLDYPKVGRSSFTTDSLSKYYSTEIVKNKYSNGGGVESGDKVIITTSSLGNEYKGMLGTINERKLLNDRYSIKLENGLEMAFSKDEFRHNSVNPRYENGGGVAKELKGYQVNIYKSSNSDSPINVVSNKFKRITLVTDGTKGDSSTVMSNEPYIKLVKRKLAGEEYLSAEPVNFGVDKAHKMFGGNFVWNSDSRFREDVSERPIPLHDRVESYEDGGKLKGTLGQSFPEVGRAGMYKGAEVIVTANRAGDILFDELDENEKVIKSDKASVSEFKSYFTPFETRDTDVVYSKGGELDYLLKEFNELTAANNHDEAAILLAENLGTDEEVSELKRIQREHDRRGYSTEQERSEMDTISNKYYYRLKNVKDINSDKLKDGGSLNSDVENLVGKWIDIHYMGVIEPEYSIIQSANVTPERFTHRDVVLVTKDGTESRFPISEINDFLSGKDIKIKGSKEPYVISLSEN